MQFAELADCLLMEGFRVGCLVEIKVATEHLVCTLTTEHHLDAHRLDDAGKQVHRGGRTDGRHVVCLDEIDDVANGIKPFLYGVVDFMMHGADVVSHQLRLCQVGSALQANREGMQTRPIGSCLRIVLDAMLAELLSNGRDDRRIKPAAEQHTIGNVGHQLTLHGCSQSIADFRY